MGQIAFLFSGQGAQTPGMGQSWIKHGGRAKAVFDMAETLRPGTCAECFEGDKETLSQTQNTQPCLFCVDLAAAEALREAGISPAAVAGFSLGEIPAAAFAGMLSPEKAFALVVERGLAMQACAQANPGSMAAVLGLSDETVEAACEAHGSFPVNYNCPGQLVIAGETEALTATIAELKAVKGRVLPIGVSGAFHTPYMKGAKEALQDFLSKNPLRIPRLPLYANQTGKPYAEPLEKQLCEQVANPVRWKETLFNMWQDGIRVFIEVGIGQTLCGLVKKTLPEATVLSVTDGESLQAALAELKGADIC